MLSASGLIGCLRAPQPSSTYQRGAVAQPAVTGFQLQVGDRAVYQGQTKTVLSRTDGERARESQGELTVTAVSQDPQGFWRIANYWVSEGDDPPARLDFTGFNLDEEMRRAGRETRLPFARFPAPPRRDLEVGTEFSRTLTAYSRGEPRLGLGADMTVRCVVTQREVVGDRSCLLVEVTSAEPLPRSLKPAALYEGGPPPKLTLTDFQERIWVAEDNGWVVKLEHSSVMESQDGGAEYTTSREYAFSLTSAGRLQGAELERELDQLDRLRSINRHRRGAMVEYNVAEDAEIGLGELAEFEGAYPESRYAKLIPVWEQGFAEQREAGERLRQDESAAPPEVGKPAPPFAGRTLDGKVITLEDLRGKPALLIFLRLTKQYEHDSAPDLEAIWREWGPKGVQVLGVCGGPIAEFRERHGITFPTINPYFPPPDENMSPEERRELECYRQLKPVDTAYRMYGYIGTVVVDAEGIIRYYRWDFYPKELGELLASLTAE
jgi:hypothetical protein